MNIEVHGIAITQRENRFLGINEVAKKLDVPELVEGDASLYVAALKTR